MTDVPISRDQLATENLRVGSEYLIANAFAYIAYGLDFDSVTVTGDGGGEVLVASRPASPLVDSCVTLAGLVVELRWDADHGGFDTAMPARIALWTDMAISGDTSSVHNIDSKHVLEALTWALAFVEANADLIAANGATLRTAGHLDYSDFADQIPLISMPTQDQRLRHSQSVLPYAADLFAIGFANKARAAQSE